MTRILVKRLVVLVPRRRIWKKKGTDVEEKYLENINRNIKSLASNQNRIIHDLDVRLSVLNLTRMQVTENRRSIMDLIVVIQKTRPQNYETSGNIL